MTGDVIRNLPAVIPPENTIEQKPDLFSHLPGWQQKAINSTMSGAVCFGAAWGVISFLNKYVLPEVMYFDALPLSFLAAAEGLLVPLVSEEIRNSPLYKRTAQGIAAVACAYFIAYQGAIKPDVDLANAKTTLVQEIKEDGKLGKGTVLRQVVPNARGGVHTLTAEITGEVDLGKEFGGVCREVVLRYEPLQSRNQQFLLCKNSLMKVDVTTSSLEIRDLGQRDLAQGTCSMKAIRYAPGQKAHLYAQCPSGMFKMEPQ